MAGINSINNDYSWLFNSISNGNAKNQNSISKLWSAYGNFQSNATGALAGLQEINTNLKSVLDSYEEAKSTFNAEFSENMDALSKSAAKLKDYNFGGVQAEGAITKTNVSDEDGNITAQTTYSKDLQAALDTVKDFVNNYNTSISFFKDNASVSNRVDKLAQTFGDAGYRAANYNMVGITVGSGGTLEIDEEKLANAIINDPDKVSSVLGKDGLAGKAESHVSFANSQQEILFPTAEKMLGDQLSAASLYTGKAYRNMAAYSNMGNLINMMF